ncbi:hypothetical protein Tco_1165999 [Tanacetum coccineum]
MSMPIWYPYALWVYYEYETFESFTCWQILPSERINDSVGSSNLDDYPNNQPQKMKRIVHDPSIVTPSKPVEERKKSRMDIEDSKTEDSSDSANAKGQKGVVEPSAKKRKNKARGTVEPWLQAMPQKVPPHQQKCYDTRNAMAPYLGGSLVGFKP